MPDLIPLSECEAGVWTVVHALDVFWLLVILFLLVFLWLTYDCPDRWGDDDE